MDTMHVVNTMYSIHCIHILLPDIDTYKWIIDAYGEIARSIRFETSLSTGKSNSSERSGVPTDNKNKKKSIK